MDPMAVLYLYGIWDNIRIMLVIALMLLLVVGVIHIWILFEETLLRQGVDAPNNQWRTSIMPLAKKYLLASILLLVINMLCPDKSFLATVLQPSAPVTKNSLH
jgi:hypothetical protein